ncbi:MAG: EcsC family protein [Candidatus Hydrogenedentes bacterium]|nr:EcsC family protein [Candidatus Hydrogenedentota bacterium]
MGLAKAETDDLRYAKTLLENPSLAIKITDLIGVPIETGLALLPKGAHRLVNRVTKSSLETALRFALTTMRNRPRAAASNRVHKFAVAATGASGGALGLAALAVELPVSTVIMLRSIADVARSEGEIIKAPETKLACLEVFALGGRARGDDAAESGYFAVRATLAKSLSQAAHYIAENGLARQAAPAVARFLARVGAQFELSVLEKAAAQAIPVLGAAGGAIVNTVFIDHFQSMARGHFIMRRLERAHGLELVKEDYLRLS